MDLKKTYGSTVKTNDSTEDRMLDGLELLHYSSQYSREIFVICFLCEARVDNLLYDLRTLQMSGIKSIVIVGGESRDDGLNLLYPNSQRVNGTTPDVLTDDNGRHKISDDHLLLYHDGNSNATLKKTALYIGSRVNSRKVILVTGEKEPCITIDDVPLSYTGTTQLRKRFKTADRCKPSAAILGELCNAIDTYPCDTVVMNGDPGGIFSEIFTYRGFGTLISESHRNVIRCGEEADTIDIMMIMRPDILSNSILPMDMKAIRQHVRSFFLYTVDNSIVAVCRLIEYDNACELAKFSTLPRYRGKGRAKDLLRHLVDIAKNRNKEYVFSLSVGEHMWNFYQNLGFKEVPRETLPRQWKRRYDFSRPSKAYVLPLNSAVLAEPMV